MEWREWAMKMKITCKVNLNKIKIDSGENNEENNDDKELIYNEEGGFANSDKLFGEEQNNETAVYEIEFKIFDKINKNV